MRNVTYLKTNEETKGWNETERAKLNDLARVMSFRQPGLEVAEGVTDEGDPWFALLNETTGRTVIHIARLRQDRETKYALFNEEDEQMEDASLDALVSDKLYGYTGRIRYG